jgi:hypothetical protein
VAAETPPPHAPYTAKEIADLSGVSYTRVSKWGLEGRLPFVEESGRRWYPSQAIVVAREIAAEHERADIDAAVRDWTGFEDGIQAVETALTSARNVVSVLETVLRRFRAVHPGVSLPIRTLPAPCRLRVPLIVIVYPSHRGFAATYAEADLTARGSRRQDAIAKLRALIAATYLRLRASASRSENEEDMYRALSAIISDGNED